MLVFHPRRTFFDRAHSARQSRGETAQPAPSRRMSPVDRVAVMSQSIRAVLGALWTERPAKSSPITTSSRALSLVAYIPSSDSP